jgi:Protein of unknown function (DUF3105)
VNDDVPPRPDLGAPPATGTGTDPGPAAEAPHAAPRRTRGLAVVVGMVALTALVLGVTLLPSGDDAEPRTLDRLLARAAAAADASGCADVAVTPPFDPPDQDASHIASVSTAPPLSGYPTTPPASGPHAGPTLPAGVYDSLTVADVYRSIHSLEHAATIVWYDPGAPAERLEPLIAFYGPEQEAAVGQDRVIVAPYDFPATPGGDLPDGTQMALVAWHRLRTCARVDLAVAVDFTSRYGFPTTAGRAYAGEAREPGAAI